MKKLPFVILLLLPLIGFGQAEKRYRSIIVDSLKALNDGRIDVKDTLLLDSLAVYATDLSSQYTSRSLVDSAFVGVAMGGAGNTIYSADDNLAGNRTVTMGANSLTFDGNLTTFKGINAASSSFVISIEDNVESKLFRVEADGNIGIGLSDPSAQLHINTANSFGSQFLLESSKTSGTAITIKNTSAGGKTWSIFSNGTLNGGGAGHMQFFDGANTPFFFHKDGRLAITDGSLLVPDFTLHLRTGDFDQGIALEKGGFTHIQILTGTSGGQIGMNDASNNPIVSINDNSTVYDFLNTGRDFMIGSDAPDAKLHVNGNAIIDSSLSTTARTTTLGAAATTFPVFSNVMTITGDDGGNTVATITGANSGMLLTLIFVDGNVTITDNNIGAANTVNLPASFTSADNKTLLIVFDGTSWYGVPSTN